ncbi:hypothetical protein [Acinetobacter nosocomialis]|uniref:hypothetical protein n=1 Tax=Acinetobacter nosocomialis TaxID=106654 RepID=UPI0024B67BA5|nr:hypothetical protein [Acinetobacter nosocomialis]MDI9660691.1 hypothetical protein [Acinetobacter nosocomialis]
MSSEIIIRDEHKKISYENNLLEIYKLLLIIRNIVRVDQLNGEIDYLNDAEKIIKDFENAARCIKLFPLYFTINIDVKAYVDNWIKSLKDKMHLKDGGLNYNIQKHTGDFITVLSTANGIIKYFNQKGINRDISLTNSNDYNLLNEKFRSIDITYDNFLAAQELTKSIADIRDNLDENLKQSDRVKEIYSSIENQYKGFNAFIEKNYNDETKKIYDDIYKNEYGLADKYRKYASIIFLTIALIATINFLIPTIEGSLNFFKSGEFKTTPIDMLFFLKTIFMLLLTAPGWYYAKESAKHRQVGYKAKIISAELTALPYYLADLEVEKRHEMRMKMADKFFGQELYNDKKSDNSNVNEQT